MNFLEIDGSQGEGGGQILRTSVSLSCIFGIPIRITKIRAGRKEAGLRPQHLQAVSYAAKITNSVLRGAEVGSTLIEFIPGPQPDSYMGKIDTSTAGSVTLIAQTLIPIAMFMQFDIDVEISGGTEVPASPSIDYLQRVILPIYRAIGGEVEIDLVRRGYYPRGGGMIRVRVKGSRSKLRGIKFEGESSTFQTKILAASRLIPSHVVAREIESARAILQEKGIDIAESQVDTEGSSFSPGNSILIYSQNDTKYVGASALGERGKKAELVGREVAEAFQSEIQTHCNVDFHLADMLVTLASCIPEKSRYSTSRITKHLETNLEIARILTGITFEIKANPEEKNYEIELSGIVSQ